MSNQSNQNNSHILFTGPSGWCYYAWSEDGRLKSKTINDLSHDLNIDVDRELLEGDDTESFREFVHVIVELSRIHGFTHIVDPDMGIQIDEPKPIIQEINRWLKDWPTGSQLRVLQGLDISHLGS